MYLKEIKGVVSRHTARKKQGKTNLIQALEDSKTIEK